MEILTHICKQTKQMVVYKNYSLKGQRQESDKSEQINVRSRHYGAILGKDGNNNAHNMHHRTPYVHLSLFRHIPTTSSLLALGPGCSLYIFSCRSWDYAIMCHLGIISWTKGIVIIQAIVSATYACCERKFSQITLESMWLPTFTKGNGSITEHVCA